MSTTEDNGSDVRYWHKADIRLTTSLSTFGQQRTKIDFGAKRFVR